MKNKLRFGIGLVAIAVITSVMTSVLADGTEDEGMVHRQQKESRHFLFVIDISGSMDSMIREVQKSAADLVTRLQSDPSTPYSVGLMSFSGCGAGDIQMIIEPGTLNNGPAFLTALSSLRTGGSTALALALEKSLVELRKHRQRLPRDCMKLIILTDGYETCRGDVQRYTAEIEKENQDCQNSTHVVFLGKDDMEGMMLKDAFNHPGSKTHFMSGDKRNSTELTNILGNITGLEAPASMPELKSNIAGGGPGTPENNRRQKGGSGGKSDPNSNPTGTPDVDSEAEAQENKNQQNGGGGR